MKRNISIVLFVLMVSVFAGSSSAGNKVRMRSIYAFGFAASFIDSVVYITDIQQLDSVYVQKKSDFLIDRAVYSDQLQSFIEEQFGVKNYMCAILYDVKRKDVEKKFIKVKKKYRQAENLIVKELKLDDFFFVPVDYTEPAKPIEAVKKKKKKDRGTGQEPPQDGRGPSAGGGPGGLPPGGSAGRF